MKKIASIQVVRAILALMVVAIHVLPENYYLRIIIRPFLNCAVAGFVFLSGYLTKTNIDAKTFITKRIRTVLFPYVLFTLFYTAIRMKMDHFFEFLLTGQGAVTLYYLLVYMQLVLLTPFLSKIIKQGGWGNVAVLLIQPLFVLCLYISVINGQVLSTSPWYVMFFPMWILYYYLGMLIGNNYCKISIKNRTLVKLAVIGIVLQIAEGFFWLNHTTLKDMYTSQIRITALLENIPVLLLIVNYIRSKRDKDYKILCRIGDASFGVYLLHIVFIIAFNKIFHRDEMNFMFSFVLAILGSLAVIFILNKKIPKKYLKYTGLALK